MQVRCHSIAEREKNMFISPVLLLCFFVVTHAKDELSTFHSTNDGQLVYYQGYATRTLNYTEAVDFCKVMGGTLPTSFEHVFPLILGSMRHEGDLFWLGPVKQANQTDYVWPNGAKFVHNQLLNTAKECLDGRCCAVAAKWTGTSSAGRHLSYIEKSCCLNHHPVCVIQNTLGDVASRVNSMHDRHESLKDELANLPIQSAASLMRSSFNSIHHRSKRETRNYIKDEATGKVYHYDSSIGSYEDSVNYCHHLGGVLTSISTTEDALFLVGILGRFRDTWLGSSKSTFSGDKYTWLDGNEFNDKLWSIPPSKDAEYALSLTSYPDSYGKMREVPCSRLYRRICLMNPPVKPTTTSRPTTIIQPTTKETSPATVVYTTTPQPATNTAITAPSPIPTNLPVTSKPGSSVDEKLDSIAQRMDRQEKLLHDLIRALKSAFNSM